VKATAVTTGLAESNGSLLPGLWRDSLHVTCGLTACTPGSAPGPILGNEYGKTLPFMLLVVLGLVSFSTEPRDCWEERLRNDLFCVKWDGKPCSIHPSVIDYCVVLLLQW